MTDTSLGALLRAHRTALDMTLESLAERSGVSDRAIGDIERGASRGPQRRTVDLLADALGVGADERAELLRLAREGRRRATAPPSPALPLPRVVTDFTGRAGERNAVAALLRGPAPRAVLLSGPPGFGKTTLAVRVADDVRGDFDEVAFVDLRGLDDEPVHRDDVARRLVEALSPSPVPLTSLDALERLRRILASQKVLVVLDNAGAEEQVRDVVSSDGPGAVLVTSRRRLSGLEGVDRVTIDRMTTPDAAALLARLVGTADDDALARVVELCGAVPLALRILGNRLGTRPGTTIATLTARLAVEDRRLDSLAVGDLSVRAAFGSSFEQLGPDAQRLLRRLSLVAAPTVGPGLAAALAQEDLWRTEEILDELVELGLLQHVAGDRYQLHDLLRLYASHRMRTQEGPEARARLEHDADRWLLSTTMAAGRWFEPDGDASERDPMLRSTTEAMAWLRHESDSWLAAFRRAAERGDHRTVVDVADSLHWFSDLWSVWRAWPEIYRTSADAAAALADDVLVATHQGYLAWARMECLDDAAGAREACDVGLAAARRCGDARQEGWALLYRAWIGKRRRESLDDSVADGLRAAEIFRAVGEREGLPQALLLVADCQAQLGSPDAAVEVVRSVIDALADPLTRPRAEVARFTEANAQVYLAKNLLATGRWTEVEDAATLAVDLTVPLGVPRLTANAYLLRGRARAQLGRHVEGVADLRAALGLREEMDDEPGALNVRQAIDRATAALDATSH